MMEHSCGRQPDLELTEGRCSSVPGVPVSRLCQHSSILYICPSVHNPPFSVVKDVARRLPIITAISDCHQLSPIASSAEPVMYADIFVLTRIYARVSHRVFLSPATDERTARLANVHFASTLLQSASGVSAESVLAGTHSMCAAWAQQA